MKLQEKDWEAPGGVCVIDVEYPDAPIAEFVNWVRQNGKSWEFDIDRLYLRLHKLNETLLDLRNARVSREMRHAHFGKYDVYENGIKLTEKPITKDAALAMAGS